MSATIRGPPAVLPYLLYCQLRVTICPPAPSSTPSLIDVANSPDASAADMARSICPPACVWCVGWVGGLRAAREWRVRQSRRLGSGAVVVHWHARVTCARQVRRFGRQVRFGGPPHDRWVGRGSAHTCHVSCAAGGAQVARVGTQPMPPRRERRAPEAACTARVAPTALHCTALHCTALHCTATPPPRARVHAHSYAPAP